MKEFDNCFPGLTRERKAAARADRGFAQPPETKTPSLRPISTVKPASGNLPPRRVDMSFNDVHSMTVEIAPQWHMNFPLPGLLEVQVGIGKLGWLARSPFRCP
ncbi:MAG: hypothetical protein FIA94_01885 [Nitrospirae bacterium]|nr:hypothetical protein [Nitrospirota bacterium]